MKQMISLAFAIFIVLGIFAAPAVAGHHDMNPCNPCAMKHEMNPCSMKHKMNPCSKEHKMNPCSMKHDEMNPCSMKDKMKHDEMNPCNPCSMKGHM